MFDRGVVIPLVHAVIGGRAWTGDFRQFISCKVATPLGIPLQLWPGYFAYLLYYIHINIVFHKYCSMIIFWKIIVIENIFDKLFEKIPKKEIVVL